MSSDQFLDLWHDQQPPEPFDPGAQIEAHQDPRHIAAQIVVATILGLDWRPVPADEHEDVGADVAFGCPSWMGYERESWRQVMVFRAGVFTSILLTPDGALSGQSPRSSGLMLVLKSSQSSGSTRLTAGRSRNWFPYSVASRP